MVWFSYYLGYYNSALYDYGENGENEVQQCGEIEE